MHSTIRVEWCTPSDFHGRERNDEVPAVINDCPILPRVIRVRQNISFFLGKVRPCCPGDIADAVPSYVEESKDINIIPGCSAIRRLT